MVVQPEIIKRCELTDGNGGFTQLEVGQVMPLMRRTAELERLEITGKIKLHHPLNKQSPERDQIYRVIYTGVEESIATEVGVFFRGTISYVNQHGLGYMLEHHGDDVTILDFCFGRPGVRDGMKVVYIPNNAEGTSNFDSDIKARLPESPQVLIMRDEGAGDIIMSVPTVREIKRRLPDCRISYATKPDKFELLSGIDCIDEIVSIHDIDLSYESPWHLVINWCYALEDYDIKRNRGSRIDSFAKHVGLELTDRELEIHPKPDKFYCATQVVNEQWRGGPIVGYVVQAAAWNRTWSPWRVGELLDEFERQLPEVDVMLIDSQPHIGELNKYRKNVINLCGKTASFMEAVASLYRCSIVVTPDTGLAHAAAAVGTETLVLCGSIPPQYRFSHYDKFDWIYKTGEVDCCPCWDWQEKWTAAERREHPERGTHKSCSQTTDVKCMKAITPREIVDHVRVSLEAQNLTDKEKR